MFENKQNEDIHELSRIFTVWFTNMPNLQYHLYWTHWGHIRCSQLVKKA